MSSWMEILIACVILSVGILANTSLQIQMQQHANRLMQHWVDTSEEE